MAAIDIDDIRAGGVGAQLPVEIVRETESTNRTLMDLPFGDAPAAPRLLVACSQTAGRGRRGRDWLMEPGRSVAFSILIERRVDAPGPALGMPIVVGLACVRALAPLAPDLRLKWPNDLLRDGRKLGGILVQARRQAGVERFVVGIGLNLLPPLDPGQRLAQPATGLFGQAPLPIAEGTVIGQVASAVLADVGRFLVEGLAPFHAAWQRLDALYGEPVVVFEGDAGETTGVARGIDSQGALLVETAQGRRTFHSGEVSVRGIAGTPPGARTAHREVR